jgi:ribulose-bisphosphate carboxylase large chain
VRAVMRVVNRTADRTGKKVMVAFNLTGDLDKMRRRHDLVLAEGGTCVMVCLNSVGIVGLHELRRHAQLPIHAHRAGWGYLTRSPALGWDYAPWQKIWRLAGADHLHVNGLRNKFSESDASVIAAARSVLAPVMPSAPMTAMPVFSSGQTGLQAHDTFAALGCADLIHTAGGGIFGHPNGVPAGVEALRESWVAAMAGVPLTERARKSAALRGALEFWR